MRLSFSILLLAASLASVQAASTNKASASCLVPGNRGMGTGEGWKDYCCENSDDCRESCIKGKCNGKANPKPPTDPGNDKCLVPSNRGMGTGEGWKDYCCENSDDCRESCIKGKCNGKANPKPPTDPSDDKCLPPTDDGSNKCVNPKNRGTGTGKGWKDYCCEDSDDCRDTCIKGKCNGKADPKGAKTLN
ncbi:hypothetical protein BCV72DRAFT_257660 [Rhizopus microsporus var. microsporus]|uniref:Uncharacterized protein n=1 Tax=Rhizopus microsporus var. microsporus TaxID=86635 RepID=A0A1X0QVD2_RHIZD|nr:hypothetical protein BCV72DRAFT_257660 [Rhizopus microsporus var. microsporus]